MPDRGRDVALVLGSGGARGLAHIGVIRELESRGYRIRALSGSSMGALVGGIHAIGALDAYERWVRGLDQTDMLGLLDWTLCGGGLIRGEALMRRLGEWLGGHAIEDLPVDYTAVAVDVERGREVWFTEGPLLEAIRASIAIPGLFVPHEIDGRTLVDGGLLNPIPVAPTLRTRTDLTIVVNANDEPTEPGPLDLPTEPPIEADAPGHGDLGAARAHADDSRASAAIAARIESSADGSAGRIESSPGIVDGWWDRVRAYVRSLAGNGAKVEAELAMSDLLLRSLETMQTALIRHHLAVFHPDLTIGIPRNACRLHEFHRARELIDYGRRRASAALDTLR